MDNLLCKYCLKEFQHLGSHLWHKHKVLARDYKEEFGLDYRYPLISETVKEKKQDRFEERREFYLQNLLKSGKKWYFKKGTSNRQRFSKQSVERARKNLEYIEETKGGFCPACKMKFEHLTSHLYNKHNLMFAKK
ncbi:MAG: hypothetical protein UT61_C0062G0009 [Candidatus Woesebacteria bacterium GW2011_GWA1_39_8]|uniref:DBF4-type domain-containing protein n=1 Tax=Candidatus Woesebacteria bacterium GW2011_GWA1_39_8 TaxID=1618552 RepID=A0A0G0PIC5_9BACT|nr:MAG: hypothetical protein UT61_C0062G0009 [Candidatus Woesebacteria bacterium GW2011_GWA1_39_8]